MKKQTIAILVGVMALHSVYYAVTGDEFYSPIISVVYAEESTENSPDVVEITSNIVTSTVAEATKFADNQIIQAEISKKPLVGITKLMDEIRIEEEEKPSFDGVVLEYSAPYEISESKLTKKGGVCYYDGHKETYYSQNVLPGGGLDIPGRHVADDGTIRDEEGYICVAADFEFMEYGKTLMTSLGPAKVYDTGCQYGIIDVYVNW